jgi:hypothetical protein
VPPTSTSYSISSLLPPDVLTAPPSLDSSDVVRSGKDNGPQYQQPSYHYAGQYPQDTNSSSSQKLFYSGQATDQTSLAQQGGNYMVRNTPALEPPLDARKFCTLLKTKY